MLRSLAHRYLWSLAVLGVLASACAETGGARDEGDPDPHARAWLESAAAANRRADTLIVDGDLDGAAQALEAALRQEPPGSVDSADARMVRQDLGYRLAELSLRRGAPADALDHADRGIALGKERDLFTANLLVVKGQSLEALGRETDAAEVYFEALEINEALLRQTLAGQDR
jgi:tetratricopeptide (TPR) repeat protein